MSDAGTAKSKYPNLDRQEEKEEQDLIKTEEEIDAQVERKEDDRRAGDQVVQQDLNQGMDTGTHSSVHRGVDWPPEFRVREKDEPDDSPKKD